MALRRRVEVLFDVEQYERLERAAQARGESIGSLVRKAVEREYLRPEARKRREAVAELLRLTIPGGAWDEVKADLLRQRGSPFEAA